MTKPIYDVKQIQQDEHDQATLAKRVVQLNSLITQDFDYISANTDVNPTIIIYKKGGSSGTVVATLTITYGGSGGILTITKS